MLTILQMHANSVPYYVGLTTPSATKYYTEAPEPDGVWIGEGAADLGLSGKVIEEALQNVCDGFSADGSKKLVQNAGLTKGKTRRVPGYELNYQAPKSVSLVWGAVPELRSQIETAFRQAVGEALTHLQDTAFYCRTGKNGVSRVRAKMVVAGFRHSANRNNECHLHQHCLVLNVGVCKDGKTRALDAPDLFYRKLEGGSYFRKALADRLLSLGFALEQTKDGWFEPGLFTKSLIKRGTHRGSSCV